MAEMFSVPTRCRAGYRLQPHHVSVIKHLLDGFLLTICVTVVFADTGSAMFAARRTGCVIVQHMMRRICRREFVKLMLKASLELRKIL